MQAHKETVIVSRTAVYRFDDDGRPSWTITLPGSYQDPDDAKLTLPVGTVQFFLDHKDTHFELVGIDLLCSDGEGPARSTHVIHLSDADSVPWWLVQLAVRAEQEV